ncbi:hypothetical protein HK099_003367 [Clydaea vesicula]|uniref:Ras guanine nucleotide exchange factor n=1 Tax=Clydaea vesicula TaxID=447962 RepID=A0AAD5U3G1_9FUNG|nr:hypothetical protein HK099_003367 [Clydaea vesicula]
MTAVQDGCPIFSPDEKGELLIRCQLPNNSTTVMRIRLDMKMWDILILICQKKELNQLDIADMKVVFNGSSKEEEVDMSLPLEKYKNKLEKLILIGRTTSNKSLMTSPVSTAPSITPHPNNNFSKPSIPPLPIKTEGLLVTPQNRRRTSIMNAQTSKTVIRGVSQEFPATVVEPSNLLNNNSGNAFWQPKLINARIKLFKKSVNNSSSSSLPIVSDFNKSVSSTSLPDQGFLNAENLEFTLPIQCSVPNQSPLSMESTEFDASNKKKDELGVLSEWRGIESNSSRESLIPEIPAFLSNSELPVIPNILYPSEAGDISRSESFNGSISSLSISTTVEPMTEVIFQIEKNARKRTISTPTAISTLRKHFSPTKSRADGIKSADKKSTDSVDQSPNSISLPREKYCIVIYSLHSNKATVEKKELKINNLDEIMEAILSEICEENKISFEDHTLKLPSLNTFIELDKKLSSFLKDGETNFEVAVVLGEKKYETICVCEDDKDVMILRNINNKQIVMAGTVEKLIDKATNGFERDNEFLDTLFMSFRSFMTPLDFFDNLICKFNAILPDDPTEADIQYFKKMKVPTQKKVLSCLKWWCEYHWHDFGLDSSLKNELREFISSLNKTEFSQEAIELTWIVTSQAKEYEDMINNIKLVERKGKSMESMILELNFEDISQQLCLLNYNLFKNIHAIEFLNQIWTKKGDESICPSLDFFISRFDKESYWVATEICSQKDLKKRVTILKNFILSAKRCQELNNFFSMFAIIAGLNLSPVLRLKKSWDALPKEAKKIFQELEKLIDPSKNMKNFRDCLALAVPPIVPFLPIYLKDLTFMNDGNQSKVREMINFDKLRMMSNRVKDITGLVARGSYKFELKSAIQNYISKPHVEKDVKKLKEMSKLCEAV